jgi:hypothetical protein
MYIGSSIKAMPIKNIYLIFLMTTVLIYPLIRTFNGSERKEKSILRTYVTRSGSTFEYVLPKNHYVMLLRVAKDDVVGMGICKV